MPKRSSHWFLLLPALWAITGCAGVRHEVHTPVALSDGRGVVYVADGAGNYEGTSTSMRKAIADQGMPLLVETVSWSHGHLRVIADQVDYARIRQGGHSLACAVCARRQHCPTGCIYLVGHSAGSGVILAAADELPPDTVDGIVLLAPSVSADYDLRPALRASRNGIDVFYSSRDVLQLGVAVSILGTADRRWTAAAGRVGFRPWMCQPSEAVLFAKLRQHPWNSCVAWTGNRGGHYDVHHEEFLRAYVLPLLACTSCSPAPLH